MKFFQISKSKKKLFQKTILSLKFKFPANNSKVFLAGNLNFKFRIVFWNIFFWRFEKRITLSEKTPPLPPHTYFKLLATIAPLSLLPCSTHVHTRCTRWNLDRLPSHHLSGLCRPNRYEYHSKATPWGHNLFEVAFDFLKLILWLNELLTLL